MQAEEKPTLSIALNVMGRLELADYGFRSWMLQDYDRPYEVVLNLFNDARPRYEKLAEGKNPHCRLVINSYDKPAFFNISAANNLAIYNATGSHILFANSDVIYLSHSARLLSEEITRRDIHYIVLSRSNLDAEQSASVGPIANFQRVGDFDFLSKMQVASYWVCINGWLARRDAMLAIGGFDPRILVCEDVDLNDRLSHYLARNNLQREILGMVDFCGYHMYHATSELFDSFSAADLMLKARRAKLKADARSPEDIITTTQLDSMPALLADLRNTVKPPTFNRYRQNTIPKVIQRFKSAFNVLAGRRLQ